MRARTWLIGVIFSGLLGCGGGGGTDAKGANPPAANPIAIAAPSVRIGGQAQGIDEPITLNLTVGTYTEQLRVEHNGRFSFAGAWPMGSYFAIAISETQQDCQLNHAQGQLTGAASVDLQITCSRRPSDMKLAGLVQLNDGFITDTSLNDVSADYRDNTTPTQAQQIPEDARILGFVSASPTGGDSARERFAQMANQDDYFRVTLTRNQWLELHNYRAADAIDAADQDIDIYLLEADTQILVNYDISVDSVVRLQVPADGDYLILIHAHRGAVNYQLQLLAAQPTAAPTLAAVDFVSGDAVVQWGAAPDKRGNTEASASPLAIQRQSPQLLKLSAQLPIFARFDAANANLAPPPLTPVQTLQAIKRLGQTPGVKYAEPNYRRDATASTPATLPATFLNDPYLSQQWSLAALNLADAWQVVGQSAFQEVVVAVIDTGIFSAHPDLRDNLVAGFDFVSDPLNAGDGDGIDANPEAVYREDAGSNTWHATHVAGIIAAQTNNGEGIAGIGINTRIMPLRVIGLNGGTSYDMAQAIRYAAAMPNDSGQLPARRADIINLSVGGYGSSQVEQETIAAVAASGVMLVASAGNRASEEINYPAGYRHVVSVTALDHTGRRSDYPNFGATIDLAAPGGSSHQGILSCYATRSHVIDPFVGGYAHMYGTSMAAPHVTGVLALMKAIRPELTGADVDAWLAQGYLSDDLGDPGWDAYHGWGTINAHKAVLAARDNSAAPLAPAVVIKALPAQLRFASAGAQSLRIEQRGGESLALTYAPPAVSWLTIEPVMQSGGEGSWFSDYRVSVNWEALSPGIHDTHITISLNGLSSLQIPVRVQKLAPQAPLSRVPLYVSLIDAKGSRLLRATPLSDATGRWQYQFDGVAAGQYRIEAGTDFNGDGQLCQPGEVCGRYHTSAQDAWLKVDGKAHNDVDIILQLPQAATPAPTDRSP